MAKTARSRSTATRRKTQATEPAKLAEVTEVFVSPEIAVEKTPENEGSVTPEVLAQKYPYEAMFFDTAWYLDAYPDVGACGMDAVEHFMTHGYLEGRDPNAHFSVAEYMAANPDIPLTINPFLHFIMHGAAEGRPLRR